MPTKPMPEVLQNIKDQLKTINKDCDQIKTDLEDIKLFLIKEELKEELKQEFILDNVEPIKRWLWWW